MNHAGLVRKERPDAGPALCRREASNRVSCRGSTGTRCIGEVVSALAKVRRVVGGNTSCSTLTSHNGINQVVTSSANRRASNYGRPQLREVGGNSVALGRVQDFRCIQRAERSNGRCL